MKYEVVVYRGMGQIATFGYGRRGGEDSVSKLPRLHLRVQDATMAGRHDV